SIVVSNWVADGSRWRSDGWTYHFPPDTDAEAIDPAYPMAPYRDMAFLDGAPLRQVGSRGEVGAGIFYVDVANNRLYVGSDPTGRTVEAAGFPYALDVVAADGTVVRGLGFRHYATGYGPRENAALRIDSASTTIEDNTFAWNATVGFVLFGPNAVVRGNTSAFNGEGGMGGFGADGLLLERNAIAYNNQEHFKTSWEGGGVKFATSRRMVWRDNLSEANFGTGFWCDISCYDTTIVRNVSRKNTGAGIHYEISAAAIIASNLVVENGGMASDRGRSEDAGPITTRCPGTGGPPITDDDRTSTKDPRITWDIRNVTRQEQHPRMGPPPRPRC
ncbi:MAG: right-handed parallel beta-helix repeat-containing protein, partial [Singulisphaera sp.]